jgi:hypothetical protein
MYILNLLLAVPLFIKNNDLPCCVNCIHFTENKNNYVNSLGKCKLFGVKNIVSCEIDNELASVCRQDKNKCGPRGKYFQEKDGFELISPIPPIPPISPLEKVEQSQLFTNVVKGYSLAPTF